MRAGPAVIGYNRRLVSNCSIIGTLEAQKNDIRFQFLGWLASQHIQDNAVGNQFHISGVFLKGGGNGGFSFGQTAKVDLGDGLANDR